MSNPITDLVLSGSQHAKARKIMVLTFHRADYALLETMLQSAQESMPDMTMEDVISMLVTEQCRAYRARKGQAAAAAVLGGGQ
jgi:hypothetical protein